jgi:glyoxylase-like metal-dependent hydrolase (beta-lactamase superfamily II)
VAVIDPGPDRRDHIAALLAALRGETITTILVTHTHKDHSPGAGALKAATGAKIVGCDIGAGSGERHRPGITRGHPADKRRKEDEVPRRSEKGTVEGNFSFFSRGVNGLTH